MIHARFHANNRSAICSSSTRYGLIKEEFIAEYQKNNGRGCCSRCANYLINNKYMVAADMTLPADVKLIIEKLTAGTQVLKEEFLMRTEEYAKKKFHYYLVRSGRTTGQWYDEFGVKHVNEDVDSQEYNGRKLYKMRNTRENERKIVKAGEAEFVSKAIQHAKDHYAASIEKLAERIKSKSMDLSKLEVKTAKIRQNIDTTITDGTNLIRAWTILAAVDSTLVRPHYRYLIK